MFVSRISLNNARFYVIIALINSDDGDTHADFSVTMKIYTHLSAEKESAGIEKLNQHVTKCLGDSIRNKVKEG